MDYIRRVHDGRGKIVFASFNRGKFDEVEPLFLAQDLQLCPLDSFEVTEPEETGLGFVENAMIKARHAAKYTNMPVLADDSGLIG